MAPESVTVHYQCLRIFLQACELPLSQALDYLWAVAIYHRPWYRSPRLLLVPRDRGGQSSLQRVAYSSDLAGLQRIPPELLDMIRQLSPDAYFWRCMSVLELSRRATTPTQPVQTVALLCIGRWKRGEQPAIVLEEKRLAFRITVDSHGIQEIERLSERPAFVQESCRYQAYIVEDAAELSGLEAHFKVLHPVLLLETKV